MALVSIIWFILTVWLAETIQIKHVLVKSEKERILNDNLTFQFYQLIERLDLIQRFKLTKFILSLWMGRKKDAVTQAFE